MKFLSKVKLSNRRYKTPEGYLVCVDSIIARTGKQEYLKSEIFQDSNDDSVIQIDRPKSEVLSPSTIASFENKPLVDEHPDEDVNVDNYRDYAIGFARDVRASKLDDVDILIANLIFTDPEAIAEIESGEKTELSCGYDCDILGEGDNLYQANIRGNHIALCKAGRAGIARIQDSSSKEIQETVNNRYSEKLKDLSPEERIKKIDELIADEEEAIVGYKEAMKYANEADKSIYAHIIAEELEHITELKTLRAENFEKNNINDAGTTRRMFRESEIGDENSWFGTTDWGTPKGNMYIYRKNGKIIAEGVYNDWYNDLQKGEKKEFNSVKELNKWLNTFTEDSNIKDIEKKEFTYNGFDVYLVGRTSDDAHYEIRYKGKGVASCDYSEDPKKEIDKLNLNVVTIYGITTERKWDISHGRAKPERTFTSLSEAQYEQKKLEREDGIPYVIFIEKEITYINNKKFFEDEENKKMRDGALKGIHLKKIRNTLRNEDEDLVEDFLDYMDTRPDLVKEYDDYSDYMVREDFETWKKYKKIKARDVDTYEEVTEGLEKELKDGSLKNEILKVGQRVHLDPERNKRLDFKLLKDEYEVVGFKYKGKTVKDDPTIDNPDVRDVSTIVIKSKSTGEIFYINRFQLKDSKIKDSDTLKNLAYKFAQMGNYFDRAHSLNSKKILGREDDEKIAEFYNLGLQVYKQLEQEVDYLKNNKRTNSNRDYGFLSETVSLLEDGANGLNKIKDDKCKLLSKKINDLLYEYKKHTYKDSKVKDKLENKPINILIKFDSSKEANDALKSLQRKEKFMNSKLVANDTIKVMTTDIDYEELKNILKLYFIKNIKTIDSKVNNSEKLLNIIKIYKKVTKDSKLKDSYVEDWWGQTNEEEPKILAKRYGLTVVALKRNRDETLYRFYGPTKNIEKAMKDGYFYNPERYVKDEKKIIKKASDSKLKDVNYEKIVEKVLDENEIYLDDVDYVEDTNRGVEILCTSYYAQLKVRRILEKAFGRVKSANYRTIILAHEDIK